MSTKRIPYTQALKLAQGLATVVEVRGDLAEGVCDSAS